LVKLMQNLRVDLHFLTFPKAKKILERFI